MNAVVSSWKGLSEQVQSSFIFLCMLSRVQPLLPHRFQPARLLLSMGLSRQGFWSGLSCPPPGGLPNPGIQLESPAQQADSLPLSHQLPKFTLLLSI